MPGPSNFPRASTILLASTTDGKHDPAGKYDGATRLVRGGAADSNVSRASTTAHYAVFEGADSSLSKASTMLPELLFQRFSSSEFNFTDGIHDHRCRR